MYRSHINECTSVCFKLISNGVFPVWIRYTLFYLVECRIFIGFICLLLTQMSVCSEASIHHFWRDHKKKKWMQINSGCGKVIYIGDVQGARKVNDTCMKLVHAGTMYRGFTVQTNRNSLFWHFRKFWYYPWKLLQKAYCSQSLSFDSISDYLSFVLMGYYC
jgi:hypothetical protein